MKIILKKDIANLGDAGEVVEVKTGYALNYLVPQGLATVGTPPLSSSTRRPSVRGLTKRPRTSQRPRQRLQSFPPRPSASPSRSAKAANSTAASPQPRLQQHSSSSDSRLTRRTSRSPRSKSSENSRPRSNATRVYSQTSRSTSSKSNILLNLTKTAVPMKNGCFFC